MKTQSFSITSGFVSQVLLFTMNILFPIILFSILSSSIALNASSQPFESSEELNYELSPLHKWAEESLDHELDAENSESTAVSIQSDQTKTKPIGNENLQLKINETCSFRTNILVVSVHFQNQMKTEKMKKAPMMIN